MPDAPRKPDFTIRALNKSTQDKGEIGVAWKNEDGSIFLKFNPFVTVPVGGDYAITAFLIGDRPEGQPRTITPTAPRQRQGRLPFRPRASGRGGLDDEVPF